MRLYKYILLPLFFVLSYCCSLSAQQWIPIASASEKNAVSMDVIKSDASTYQVHVVINGLYDQSFTNEEGAFHGLSLGMGGTLMNLGEPALPLVNRLIAIPPGARISASIVNEKWTDIDMGIIWPVQIPQHYSNKPTGFTMDNNAYGKDYVPKVVSIGEEHSWCGIRNVGVYVCPFRYNATANKLSVMSDFVLSVDFPRKDGQSTKNVNLLENERYACLFDNKVFVDESNNKKLRSISDADEYLIIVANTVLLNSEELKRFKRWKSLMGYDTKTVLLSSIGTSAADIKQYISNEFGSGGGYVLLVGDDNSIPVASVPSVYFPTTNILSDYWYGCTGTDNWIANIAVGRFPTNNAFELGKMVEKTIRYERTAPLCDSILLVAHQNVPDDYYGYQKCCQNIKNATYSEPAVFSTAYGASVTYNGNDATNGDVVNKINQGVPIVNYRGYGYPSYWGGEDGGSSSAGWNSSDQLFYNSQASNMDSTACAVFFSVSANTGNITANDNMLETFMRAPYGAVAFVGSTASSYPIPNHNYDMMLYQSLFNNYNYKLGYINARSHYLSTIAHNEHGMFKDNALSYICGGDPALELWTDSPYSFGNVALTENNGYVTIRTEHYGNYEVSVVSENGDLINLVFVSGNSCTFVKPLGNFYVGIHEHNYLPHIIYYDVDAEAIQNVTYDYDAYYHNTPLLIGYGVTADWEDGEVVVKKGCKLIIKNGPGDVTLDNGFKCESGAVLVIK